MQKFLKVVVWVIIIVILSHVAAVLAIGGYADPFYRRFTSPPQKSLILGTSKAAQGLVPNVLDSILENKEGLFFNYAFTINTSPFGKIYYESVRSKLDLSTKNGIFIITVDPWSISSLINQPRGLGRENGFLDQIGNPNRNPNWEYLMRNYKKTWGSIFVDQLTNFHEYLHEDGWLEIRYQPTGKEIETKIKSKVKLYSNRSEGFELSQERLDYLVLTIELLQNHGTTYLVRLPVSRGIHSIEQQYLPEFDNLLMDISKKYGIPYFNYNDRLERYKYKDGNHMTTESAKLFSADLAKEINEL